MELSILLDENLKYHRADDSSTSSICQTSEHIENFMRFVSNADQHHEGEFLAALSLASRHFYHDNCDEHDVEVESGVAAGLAATLRVSLSREHPNMSKSSRFSNVQGLHVVVLASSLATVLQCSDEVLANHVCKFQDDIIISSEKMTNIFSIWPGDPTIQQVALSSITKTIRYIGPHVDDDALLHLLGNLLKIVNLHTVSPDIRAEAAATVCSLARHKYPSETSLLENNSSALISTLSTASLPLANAGHRALIVDLYRLATRSKVFQVKMIKRRCTVLAVANSLTQSTDETKGSALEFCQALFSNPECLKCFSSGQEDNFDILVQNLIRYTQDEQNTQRQLAGVSLLRTILSMDVATPKELMDTLRCTAYGGETDDIIEVSALAYCEGTRKELEPDLENLWTLVDFTTFPFANVRAKALESIEQATSKSDSAKALLNDTDMMNNFALIVRHGSDKDCSAALDIVRKLARSSLYHVEICKNVGFLREIVDFVTKDRISNRSGHFYAVEVVLALLSNKENTTAFLPFRSLLPWLVSFVNTTTAGDDFKQQVVPVIIRLSKGYLSTS